MRILLAGATFFTGVLQTFADPLLPSATAADTTHAIQAAIDAAGSGGTVTLGAGTFEIDAQLMVTNGVTLQGQGWDSTIIKQTASGQRVATLDGGASLIGVTATGARLNAGWTHGAGLLVDDGTVSWCCVSNNVNIGRNVHGGGVNITKGTIDHCIVAFNQAGTYTSSGGGIGTYNTSGTFVIDTCLVHGNTASVTDTAGKGGGICVNMGNPSVTIRNTTIAGNSSSGSGGGFYNGSYGNKVKLVNTLVAGNTANSDADSYDGTLASGSSNNLVGGNPSFVGTANGDFHLSANSPAIGAGTTYTGIDKDLDNITFANPPAVGCYEYANRIAEPVFDPASGATFYPSTNVTLACATENATIYYTTDGTDPTDASPEYTAPIAISTTTTIKAIAYKQGIDPSAIVSAIYTYEEPPPPPPEGVIVPGETPAETTETIQGAIDAAARLPDPGMVTLGNGLFEINAQLMVTGGVTLVGQGWTNTVIRQTVAGSNARCATVSGGAKIEGATLTGGHTRAKFEDGAGALVDNGTISWCCITNNQTGDASWAGATVNNIYGAGVRIKSGTIDHSIIAFNTAYMNGGGASDGGGLGIYMPTGPVLLEKCLIYGNLAPNGNGGGIYAHTQNNHHLITVRNTTIANNRASSTGGGAYLNQFGSSHDFAMINTIFADNFSNATDADPNLALPGNDSIVSGYAAQSYNNLFANGTAALGTDSRSDAGSGSAWFVNAANGDYHLTATSPAKGAGMAYERIGVDLDNVAFANPPSIGCYEVPAQKKSGVIIFVH